MEVTASWIQDALFQPEPRARYRAMLELGYADAFRSLHPGHAGIIFDKRSSITVASESTISR
jgi:exonuclease III